MINLVNWQVNMLWSEKIHFVKKVIEDKIFDTEFYGWCDIGYFRCRENMDIPQDAIQRWPDWNKIKSLSQNKIYYCQVCSDEYLNKFIYYNPHLLLNIRLSHQMLFQHKLLFLENLIRIVFFFSVPFLYQY